MSGSNLERRYRALLRALPAWYRAEREEEMVALFLTDRDDDLDLEHGWPGWGETGATLGLAVRVRFAAGRRAGEVVRLIGVVGLVWQSAMLAQGWTATVRSGPPGGPQGWWLDLVAVGAFVALLTGRRTAARVATGALGALNLAGLASSLLSGTWWPLLWHAPAVVVAAAVVAGFHRDAPPVSRRWWAVGAAGVAAGVVSALALPLSPLTILAAWLVTAAAVAACRPWTAAVTPSSAPGSRTP